MRELLTSCFLYFFNREFQLLFGSINSRYEHIAHCVLKLILQYTLEFLKVIDKVLWDHKLDELFGVMCHFSFTIKVKFVDLYLF